MRYADTAALLASYLNHGGYGLLKNGQQISADTSAVNGLATQYALSQKLATADTLSLSNRIEERLRWSDTSSMLLPYVQQAGYGLLKTGQLLEADTSGVAALATKFDLAQKPSWTDTAAVPGLPTKHEVLQRWHLDGNSGVSGTNYLGISDNMPLSLRSNGAELLRLVAPNGNSRQVRHSGAVVNEALVLPNFSADGSLGASSATVDQYECIVIAQTTANVALTISNPSTPLPGAKLTVVNSGTVSLYLRGVGATIGTSVPGNAVARFVHNGNIWQPETVGGSEFFGTLRPNISNQCAVLDDATHQSHNLATVVTNPGGGNFNFSVENLVPEEKVATSLAVSDDTFAENGVYAGTSQLATSTRVQLARQGFGVYISYNGSNWTASTGGTTDLVTAADFTFSFDPMTGVLTVFHSSMTMVHEIFNISVTPRDGVNVYLNAVSAGSFQLVFREMITGSLIANPTTACRVYVGRNGMWVPSAAKLRNLGSGNVWLYGRFRN